MAGHITTTEKPQQKTTKQSNKLQKKMHWIIGKDAPDVKKDMLGTFKRY